MPEQLIVGGSLVGWANDDEDEEVEEGGGGMGTRMGEAEEDGAFAQCQAGPAEASAD